MSRLKVDANALVTDAFIKSGDTKVQQQIMSCSLIAVLFHSAELPPLFPLLHVVWCGYASHHLSGVALSLPLYFTDTFYCVLKVESNNSLKIASTRLQLGLLHLGFLVCSSRTNLSKPNPSERWSPWQQGPLCLAMSLKEILYYFSVTYGERSCCVRRFICVWLQRD